MQAFTTAIADQDNAEFFFAPRVYTVDNPAAAAPQPIFRQVALWFNKSDGSIYYQQFGELAAEFDSDGTGADFIDSGHSLGSGDTSTNFFRTWSQNVITWNDDIYMTGLHYNGFSGGSGAGVGGAWQTQSGAIGSPSLPIRYDAQDISFTRPLVHDLDGDTTGFPRARTCVAYHDRIFAANVHKTGSYRYPSRLYWSNAGTAETWGTNSWIGINTDDGQEITAIVPFGEQMLIFKNNSTYTLVGTDEDTFALYPIDVRIGTEGTYAATAAGGVAYFFDTNTCTIWSYDGARFNDVGEPISAYVRANLNYNATFKIVVQVFGHYLWFSYPKTDGSPTQTDENTETLVFDMQRNAWTRWTFGIVPSICARYSDYIATGGAGAVTPGNSNPYFVVDDASNDSYVAIGYMGSTNTDAATVWTDFGANYSFEFRTAWFSPDNGNNRNRIRRFGSLAAENSNDLTVALYRDFINTAWQTFVFDPLAETENILEYHLQQSIVDVNGMFNWLACKVTASHADEAQVNALMYSWSRRGGQRGDMGGTGYDAV
jgi:hypothetical protein